MTVLHSIHAGGLNTPASQKYILLARACTYLGFTAVAGQVRRSARVFQGHERQTHLLPPSVRLEACPRKQCASDTPMYACSEQRDESIDRAVVFHHQVHAHLNGQVAQSC